LQSTSAVDDDFVILSLFHIAVAANHEIKIKKENSVPVLNIWSRTSGVRISEYPIIKSHVTSKVRKRFREKCLRDSFISGGYLGRGIEYHSARGAVGVEKWIGSRWIAAAFKR
jgi:hypothetical protein